MSVEILSIDFITSTAGLDSGFADVMKKTESLSRDLGSVTLPDSMPQAAQLGDEIRSALVQGMAPLGGFATRFEKSFDRVGGTIITLARRLDSSMKFPSFDAFLGKVQERIPTAFGKASVGAIRFVARIQDKLGSLGDVAGKSLGKLGFGGVSGGVITSYARLTATITGIGPAATVATKATKALGGQLAASLGILSGFGAVVGFFSKGIKGASDLGETVSKVGVVFGDSTKQVQANANELATAFGLPKKSILDASASIGLVGKAAGQSEKEAADMGVSLSKLAADAASFYNVPLDEALGKIRSGLVGESEPLRAFGVLLSDDAVKAEAMRLGLQRTGKAFDQQAMVQARASLITRGLADASGDLARTQDSTANQSKKLVGSIGNLAVSLGQYLLPAVDTVLRGFNGFTSGITTWVESNKSSFQGIGTFISGVFTDLGSAATGFVTALTEIGSEVVSILTPAAEGFSGFGETIKGVFDTAGVVARNFGSVTKIVWIELKQAFINMGEWIGVIPANLSQVATYIANNWRNLIVDAVSSVGTVFKNLGSNLWELGKSVIAFLQDPTQGFQFNWSPLLDGFKATAEKLPELIKPELTSLQGEIDKAMDAIGKNETKRADRIAGELTAKVQAATAPKSQVLDKATAKPSERKFAGAAEFGSKEAYSTIVQANSGQQTGIDAIAQTNKQQLAQQSLANKYLADIAQGIAKGATKAVTEFKIA